MSGVGCTFHCVDDNEWRWLYFSLCGRQCQPLTCWKASQHTGDVGHCVDDNASPSLVGKLHNIQGMSVTVWTTMPAPHLLESLTTYWGCRSLCGRQCQPLTCWKASQHTGDVGHCVDDNASPSLVGKLDNILGMSVTVWTTMPAPHLLESFTTYRGCRSLCGQQCQPLTCWKA